MPSLEGRLPSRPTSLLCALIAIVALALPASASAADFLVDSTGDGPPGDCETATPVDCTLRAAIEESNDSDAVKDTITFDPAVFDGKAAGTISPATPLPPITAPVGILSGGCETKAGVGPCAAVAGPAGQPVFAIEAGETTIAGLAISGGQAAVEGEGDGLLVTGNWIGLKLDGFPTTAPAGAGIVTGGSTGHAQITGNLVRMDGGTAVKSGTGIEVQGGGAEVLGNSIIGASNGILLHGDTGGAGNLIQGNAVGPSGNSALTIESDDNEVLGNLFGGSAFSTLFLKNEADGNRIGGDDEESENTFTGSAQSPIAIVAKEDTQNEIARNRGEINGGKFILIHNLGSEANLPNGGTPPPEIAKAIQSGATGIAEPGARVRVFRKATEEPGEIESFLGEAVADGSGGWAVAYPSQVPSGTQIAATQTNTEGGTSELAIATSAVEPQEKEKEPPKSCPEASSCLICPASTGSCGGPFPPRPRLPDTTIAKKPKPNGGPTAKFKFTATVAGSSFECKLDKRKFARCRSPKTYKKLKPGKHVFKVRAVSPIGLKDPSPATKAFKVKAG